MKADTFVLRSLIAGATIPLSARTDDVGFVIGRDSADVGVRADDVLGRDLNVCLGPVLAVIIDRYLAESHLFIGKVVEVFRVNFSSPQHADRSKPQTDLRSDIALSDHYRQINLMLFHLPLQPPCIQDRRLPCHRRGQIGPQLECGVLGRIEGGQADAAGDVG